jgi:hypothetical protein
MSEKTDEVNGIFSRTYIYTCICEKDIVSDIKSGLPFFLFWLLYGIMYIHCVLESREKRKKKFDNRTKTERDDTSYFHRHMKRKNQNAEYSLLKRGLY